MNSTFYPAIQKPNARLVTQGIDRIEKDGVVTKDGELHQLDVLVLATGFDPAAYMRPMEFRGRNGLSIDDAWKKKVQAYRSLLIPEFPNFFLMLGPNSPIGNYSVIAMSEMQADYCIALIKLWQQHTLQDIEVKPQAVEQWRAMLKSKMNHTVWSSGCNSWYLDADGDPLTWPDKWKNWVAMMKTVNIADMV
jgi:cation diffusion facilitator CzcD-associated flavoprotein CzcO